MTKKKIYFIGFLLLITFIVTSYNVIQFFNERASFQYSDWLINYQAGFVRRGFVGEIFFQLSNILQFRLDILILVFVLILYMTFYLNFYSIIRKINIKLIDLFVILSPISFFYTAFEQKASGRKEIIFLSLFSVFILIIKKISPLNQIFLIILITTITALTHSGLIFYNVYFFALFVCYNLNLGIKKISILLLPFIFSSLITLIFISNNSTISSGELEVICRSIIEYLPNCGKGDYVTTLTWGLKNNFEGFKSLWLDANYIIFYFLAFILCFGFFLYISNTSKLHNFNFLFVIILCMVSTLPLYLIGADYGRYMYVSYLSSILIYYFLLSENIIKRKINFYSIKKIIIIPILVVYSFTFTIPLCCKTKLKFNYIKLID